MVKRRDLWGRRLSLIKKTAWEGSWMTKNDYVLQLFLFSSFFFSFSPSFLSFFFSDRTIHLSQMNTNAMPDYRRKRWRIGVHEKRPNKPISISRYRIILALVRYHVKKSLRSLPSPFETQKNLCKNTCDSSDKKRKKIIAIFCDCCELHETSEDVSRI